MSDGRKVGLFLSVTFLWSWGFWAIPVLAHRGVALPPALQGLAAEGGNPAAWGPLVGAIVTALAAGGFGGLWRLARRGLAFSFGWRWWLVILLTFPVLVGGSALLGLALGDPPPGLDGFQAPAQLPFAFVYILALGGPLQEEFGWRGTLLDPLQGRFGALFASLVVGAIWGAWHLPMFYQPTEAIIYERPFWGLLVSCILISVLFTWIYNNTGGSVAAVILFHTMFNFTHYALAMLLMDNAGLILFIAQTALLAWVVWRFGPGRLSRAPAGQDPTRLP